MLAARVKQLSKDSLIYGIGGALARSIGIVLLLLYANFFSKDTYGAYSNIVNSSTLFFTFLVFGMDGVSSILYFDTNEASVRRAVTSAWLYFELMLSVPVCLLLLLLAAPLAGLATNNPGYSGWMILAICTVPFTLLTYTFTSILRLNFRPVGYVALSGLTTILNVGMGLVLVVLLGWGVTGALVSTLISGAISTLLGLWLTRSNYLPHPNWQVMGRMLRLGWPLLPGSLALWINSYASGFFLLHLISPAEAGVFSVTLRLAVIIGVALTAFQLAWTPYSLSIAGEADAPRTYAKVLTYYVVAFGGLALALGLFGREVLTLIDRKGQGYTEGYQVLGLLIYSSVIAGAYYIVAVGSNIAKKTVNIGGTTVVASAVNIALNFSLIPSLGMVGSALASLTSSLLTSWLIYLLSQRYYPIPYESGKVLLTLTLGLGLMLLGLVVNSGHWWLDALIKLGILAVYTLALPVLGLITRREMEVALQAFTQRLRRS